MQAMLVRIIREHLKHPERPDPAVPARIHARSPVAEVAAVLARLLDPIMAQRSLIESLHL
jgi:hypothetical protein